MSNEKRKCMVICLLALFIGLIGIVLPEIDVGVKHYINASYINQSGLSSFPCSINNVSNIDNLNCTGVEGSTPFYIDFNFTNVTNFTNIETKLYYNALTGFSTHEVHLEIFCINEDRFIVLERFNGENQWQYFSNDVLSYTHFIRNDGNVTLRINHTENGITTHRVIVDVVRLVNDPNFEQNIINLNQTIGGGTGTGSQNLSQVLSQGNSSNQSINMMGYGLINSSTNITTLGGTYYIGKNGTDNTSCGGNTSPCLTINYMVAKLNAKPVLLENVTVHIYPGIYNENINVGGIYPGNYKLILEGEYKILNTLFVSSNNSGSTTSQAFFNSSISMTANAYKNKIMYVVNGSNSGQYRIVDNNSADNLTYVGLLTNPLATGTQINILEWNTTIKPNNPVSIKLEAMSGVYINDIALDGGISAKFSSYFINRANLTTYFTPTNPFLTTYSGQISSVYEVDTTIIQHDGTPNYVLWYTQFSSTLFKKSKIDHGSDFIGTIVQQGYFLSQEGSVYNGSYISIYVDNNGNFQADSTNGANPQYSFVKQNFGFGVNIVDGTCTNCLAGDPFPGIVYISNAVDFQTKYSGIGTDFACFNTNGTLIRQNLAC